MAASCEGDWNGRRKSEVCSTPSCSFISPEASVIAEVSFISMLLS
jgi:hypothetical protein